jgi:hypothetical protein
MLRLVADAGATLAAVDEEMAAALAPERNGRAVVLDDNSVITLAVFSSDRQSAAARIVKPDPLPLRFFRHVGPIREARAWRLASDWSRKLLVVVAVDRMTKPAPSRLRQHAGKPGAR